MSASAPRDAGRILLTGATGYVGGRLLRLFEAEGLRVRCLLRRPASFPSDRPPTTELVRGDVGDPASVAAAMRGVTTAYYLVHSMGAADDFEVRDRRAAEVFGAAAAAAGVQRIIYLGGLGDEQGELSAHLRSRHEVGRILRASGVSVIEFRASIIIGSGSLSFEMIRALVERLPAMITPRWVSVLAQPIGIEDVLRYLRAALDLELRESRVYEIGGPDRVSYGDLMTEYARQRGLRRFLISVPVLTPRLSSLWLGLVTPLYARVGRKLVDSICHPTLVVNPAPARAGLRNSSDRRARGDRARVGQRGSRARRRRAGRMRSPRLARRTSGAARASAIGWSIRAAFMSRCRRLPHSRRSAASAAPAAGTGAIGCGDCAASSICSPAASACGAAARDPEQLVVGDALDWWRVEAIEPDRRLRLVAEMKLPGRAWLEFEVTPDGDGAKIRQTAIFDPVGLAGLAYWYGIYPLHELVFARMLRGIAQAACGPRRELSR